MNHTTIAAISTPMGTGGVAIVRISGVEAIPIAQKLFRANSGKRLKDLKGFSGVLGRVYDERGDLDDAIAFVYHAPKSYTGEDTVELSCHGGDWTVRSVLRCCFENGAQPAAPGEFTKRAFLNGKIDLTQAEAVSDLISAQGDSALRAAMAVKDGALSGEISSISQALLEQSAHLAAWADYPEEEIEAVESEALAGALRLQEEKILRLLATWDQGRVLRNGIETVIVGRPNVGKSTLMNLLAGEPCSIVTDVPGTTRDIVRERIRMGDLLLILSDTAGIRKTDDQVERMGVDNAKRKMDTADLILAVFDSSLPLTQEDRMLLGSIRERPCIAVLNKTDLAAELPAEEIREFIPRTVSFSALTGQGKIELEKEIVEILGVSGLDASAAMVHSERQRKALTEALESVREAISLLKIGMTLDAVNVSIDFALDALLALTGQKASEAVIDAVFEKFCVGK